MGNIQKKLMGRSDGGRRSRRGRTPRPRAEQQGGPRETETAGSTKDLHPGEPQASQDPGDLKSQGNELFRSGQFAEAAAQYSAAIAQLEPAGKEDESGHRGVPGLLRSGLGTEAGLPRPLTGTGSAFLPGD